MPTRADIIIMLLFFSICRTRIFTEIFHAWWYRFLVRFSFLSHLLRKESNNKKKTHTFKGILYTRKINTSLCFCLLAHAHTQRQFSLKARTREREREKVKAIFIQRAHRGGPVRLRFAMATHKSAHPLGRCRARAKRQAKRWQRGREIEEIFLYERVCVWVLWGFFTCCSNPQDGPFPHLHSRTHRCFQELSRWGDDDENLYKDVCVRFYCTCGCEMVATSAPRQGSVGKR